jgi:signal transduction histidine kinase
VELAVTELPPLPAAVGLSVYRIVQEALSNATRHATGAPVEVRVAAADREVVVAVENARPPGAGAPEPAVRGAGHGLVGIRERVHLLGGSWRAGPTAGGGFRVDARLPVHPDGFRVPPPSQS